ncbi:hypothetical protein JTB14_032719 [Gonioctena quinquepunctata]|nr:hypothetical protein JTB14_032719 [Gonioctena quinquepunctata]
MSGNTPPAIEVVPPENTHGGGPFITPNRMRNNNNQNPLFNVRDRLFHTLFYRAALAYARAFPRPLRRFLEFLILIKAIAAFFVLVYIHITFSRSPSTCLAHVKETWPRDGILRVEIVRNPGKDYNIEQSYAKEEKLKQGKAEDFVHVIGLLAREGFIYIEPTAVEDTAKETQPLEQNIQNYAKNSDPDVQSVNKSEMEDSLLNVSRISRTVWWSGYDMLTAYPLAVSEKPSFLDIIDRTDSNAVNSTEIMENTRGKEDIPESSRSRGYPEDEYIVEFSLEFGFLRLSPATRARLNIPVEIVTLDPEKDECFGDAFSRLVLDEFLGYDDLLLASIKTLAEKEDNKGYLRNVVSGEHYRFVSMWMARTSYFAAFFIMIVFTVSVSMLLRYSHHQIFVFIVDLLQMLEFNVTVTFPAAPLLTVILALVGEYSGQRKLINFTSFVMAAAFVVHFSGTCSAESAVSIMRSFFRL